MDDSLLAYLQEGRKDSSGTFTLVWEKAAEKLRHFQLAEPHLYVLHVISTAVASGATQVVAYTDADDCILDLLGGAVPSQAELQQLPREWEELTRALSGASALNPALIRVLAWNGSQGAELRMQAERVAVVALPQPPWPKGKAGLRFHVRDRFTLGTVKKYLEKISGSTTREGALLYSHCAYSPLPIRLNGQLISRPYHLGSCHMVVHVDGGHSLQATWNGQTQPRTLKSPGKFSAWLGLGVSKQWGQKLLILVGGVAFEVEPDPLDDPQLRGVVLANFLSKDLSQSRLVKDAAYSGLLRDLRNIITA